MCTQVEIPETTINMIAVKLSYKKVHLISKKLEKIQ